MLSATNSNGITHRIFKAVGAANGELCVGTIV